MSRIAKLLQSEVTVGGNGLLFTGLTSTFLKQFAFDLWVTAPLLLSLATVIAPTRL